MSTMGHTVFDHVVIHVDDRVVVRRVLPIAAWVPRLSRTPRGRRIRSGRRRTDSRASRSMCTDRGPDDRSRVVRHRGTRSVVPIYAFRTTRAADENIAWLASHDVVVDSGPTSRFGSQGWGMSVYCPGPERQRHRAHLVRSPGLIRGHAARPRPRELERPHTVHLASEFYDVDGWLRSGRGPRRRELNALGDVSALSLVHLQCHFGLDTLQFAWPVRRSPDSTSRRLRSRPHPTSHSAPGCRDAHVFVCADVYGRGPCARRDDLRRRVREPRSADVATKDRRVGRAGCCTRETGRTVLPPRPTPIAWALADDELVIEHTYFEEHEPFVDESGETYTGSDQRLANARTHEWNHSLGEIITALVHHGLQIEWLAEHDWTVWPRFPWLVHDAGADEWSIPPGRPRVPLTFSLLANRPDVAATPDG